MEHTQARASTPRPVIFRDGIGRRCRMLDAKGMEKLEVLCLYPELATPSFEAALRERVGQLTSFRHTAFAKIRAVQHLKDAASTLVLVSECTSGLRLAELLATTQRLGVALDSGAAWTIIRQLVTAVAALHEHAPDLAHGAIAPERIVITPDARLVVVEHVMGSALQQLRFSEERYWKELRIASSGTSGTGELDLRADVMQLGLVALAVTLGRPLRDDEYPARLPELIESASKTSVHGDHEPLPMGLRTWLDRTLHVDERRSFASAIEASVELDRVLGESESVLVPLALEAFLTRFQSAELVKRQAPAETVSRHRASPEPVAEASDSGPAADDNDEVLEPEPLTIVTARTSRKPKVEPRREATPPPNADESRTSNPALLQFDRPTTTEKQPRRPSPWRRPGWAQKAWGRQTITAVLLTVLCGAGWLFASRVSEVRAENATPEIRPDRSFSAEAPVPAIDTGAVAASPVVASFESQPIVAISEATAKPVVAPPTAVAATPAPAATPPAPPPASGWMTVSAQSDLQVFANGVLHGTSRGGRIPLAAGTHQIELVNESIGYRTTRTVQIRKAETASINVELPNGVLALNATPWAEVLIDGTSVGETPIGNLPVRLGSHEVVFRHPELGEQRMTATVSATAPTRLSVDMRKR